MRNDLENKVTSRLVIGITGASGAILGIRMLESLHLTDHEIHLIISKAAQKTIAQETSWNLSDVFALADFSYDNEDIGAIIASGSFTTRGMIVIPCSIKTLSAIANSYTSDLIARAADVTLKEGRPLTLVVREAPLHLGHLRLMNLAAKAGATIFPPIPVFYSAPQSVDEIINNIVGRVLARTGIDNSMYAQWGKPVE